MQDRNCLVEHLDKLHTTELGAERVRRNLRLEADDVAAWCRETIRSAASAVRRGKNWYVEAEGCVITVNARSYTIITAHPGGPPERPVQAGQPPRAP